MSSVSLGGLTVHLAADTAGFQTDMGRAARIVQQRSNEIRAEFAAIGRSMAGAFGALSIGAAAGAFGVWIKGALDAQDKADELGQKIGLTATQVSKLSVAAKFSATDLEGVAKSMVKLAQNASASVAGSKQQAAAFNAIGVSVTNANGSIKDGDQLLGEIAAKMSRYKDGAEKTTLAIALFGKTGADMIPMLNEGKEALEDWGKMAEQFGLTVSVATGKAAAEFADNVDKIHMAGQGIANTIAAELAPALAKASGEFVKFLRSDEWQKWLATIRAGARLVADHFGQITGALKLVGEVAVIVIGGKLVQSLALATWNVGALTIAAIKNAFAAGGMGAAWKAAGGNIMQTTAASVKSIGAIPLALGVVTAAIAGWEIGTYLRDQFVEARLFGIAFVEGVLVGWEKIKQGGQLMWAAISYGWEVARDTVLKGIAYIVNAYAGALERLPTEFGKGFAADLRSYAASLTPVTDATAKFNLRVAEVNATTALNISNVRKITGEMAEYEIAVDATTQAFKAFGTALDAIENKYTGSLKKGTKEYAAVVAQINAEAQKAITAGAAQADVQKRVAEAIDAVSVSAKAAAPNVRDMAADQAEATKKTTVLADAQQKMADILGNLRAAADPVAKVWEDSAKAIRDLAAVGGKMIENGASEAAVHDMVREALALLTKERKKALAVAEKQKDVLGDYLKSVGEDRELIGMSDRQKRITLELRQQTRAFIDRVGPIKENAAAYRQLTEAVKANAGALFDEEKAYAVVQRYRDMVVSAYESMIDAAADWAVNGFKNTKDFWKGLVDTAKRAIAQLLAEWAKTKIIGTFKSNGGAGFWATLFQGAASFFGGDSSDKPVKGFLQRYGSSAGGGAAASSGAASAAPAWFTNAAGWVSGNSAAIGAAGAWAGAAGGVYYGLQQGDGGLGTAGSAVAGGIVGYYAATVATSAFLGASAGAATGVAGAAATGAIGGASGAVAAIPIVGWVAAIALIVDKVTGGKIFGSKYRPESIKETVSFGANGPSATAFMTEWKYRNQLSQAMGRFGGALLPSDWGDKDRRGRAIPVDPEVLAAIKKVFDALEKTALMAAKRLGVTAMKALDATFETLTVYDKKGKVKRTETIGTILGKQYKEDFDQFQKRMHAELIIATVGQLSGTASAIAEAYRKNADELLDAAQTMLQAQRDLKDNQALIGGGRSLDSIMAWVEQQRQGDEDLTQTYQRLADASAQYRDILAKADEAMRTLGNTSSPVDQMREALYQLQKQYEDNVAALNKAAEAAGLTAAYETDLAKLRQLNAAQIAKISKDFFAGIDAQIAELTKVNTPAGDFAAAMRAIHKSMLDNIAMANMVARAAGQQGASESQLARIHELAARQAVAALNQLQGLARQQARSLGYLGPQTVAEIDARIAELQGRADAAAQAVEGFGGAMASAAQQASNAINLLLGNLSPLNDIQKLQVALQGLYAGTASQEQVLEIGRRLYASSQAYTDLFWQVMAVPNRAAGGGGRGGGGRTDTNAAKPLTASEQAELQALRDQRAVQLKQERYLEANDFANSIASIARAQGISFEDVAKQIGFSLDDLGKDLGMDRETLLKYLNGIDVNQDAIPDSITSNTDRILARLDLYWGGDDETPAPGDAAAQGRGVGLPVEDITRELAAGREEARQFNRDLVAAVREGNTIQRQIVDTNREAVAVIEPRNTNFPPRGGGGIIR